MTGGPQHLLHVGMPKTGTNYLREWFGLHPQVGYAPSGIAGFGDVYAIVREAADPPAVPLRWRVTSCEGFAIPTPGFGGFVSDVTTVHATAWPASRDAACSTLAGLFPGAHVLLVTRGFESILGSFWSQYVRTGGDLPFDAFCAAVADRAAAGRNPLNYDALVTTYRGAFGTDRVHVLPYELLRDDHLAFGREIEVRLGLDAIESPEHRVNESLTATELLWYRRGSWIVRRLPVSERSRGRVLRRYVAAINRGRAGRLGRVVSVLDRAPAMPRSSPIVPAWLVEGVAGHAELLRGLPNFEPYAAEYRWAGTSLDDAGGAGS